MAGTVPGTQTQRVLTSSQESPLLSFRFDFAWEWVILSVEADLTCGPVREGEAGSSRTVYVEGLGLNSRSCSRTVVHGWEPEGLWSSQCSVLPHVSPSLCSHLGPLAPGHAASSLPSSGYLLVVHLRGAVSPIHLSAWSLALLQNLTHAYPDTNKGPFKNWKHCMDFKWF